MTSSGNRGTNPTQEAISLPLGVALNEPLIAASIRLAQRGAEYIIPFPRSYDPRQDYVWAQDLLCMMTTEALAEMNVFRGTTAGKPCVVANVNGVPIGSSDSPVYLIGDKSKEEIYSRQLLSKYVFAGVSGMAIQDGQLFDADFHGSRDINVHLDDGDIPIMTRVCLALPRHMQHGGVASSLSNGNQSRSNVDRVGFTITPFSTQSVSEYTASCLNTYLAHALNARTTDPHDQTKRGSFYDIRDTQRHSNLIMDRTVRVGHTMALGFLGVCIEFLLRLLKGGHIVVGTGGGVTFDPEGHGGDAGKVTAADKAFENAVTPMGEFFGVISAPDGSNGKGIERGYKLLEETLMTDVKNKLVTKDSEINNICNNAQYLINTTVASVVEEEFSIIGTVLQVKGKTESGNAKKHLVHGFWSSVAF